MSVPDLVDGALPQGRHVCSEDEIRAAFVEHPDFAASSTRMSLWMTWSLATSLLTSAVKVHRAWISGSFVTDKVDPGDFDVTYIINEADRQSRSAEDRQIVESFVVRVPSPSDPSELIPAHGLSVDTYIINWRPFNTDPATDPQYQTYAFYRGYWDDWWTRKRTGTKADPVVPEDALPRRGYLEVNLDDFTV